MDKEGVPTRIRHDTKSKAAERRVADKDGKKAAGGGTAKAAAAPGAKGGAKRQREGSAAQEESASGAPGERKSKSQKSCSDAGNGAAAAAAAPGAPGIAPPTASPPKDTTAGAAHPDASGVMMGDSDEWQQRHDWAQRHGQLGGGYDEDLPSSSGALCVAVLQW